MHPSAYAGLALTCSATGTGGMKDVQGKTAFVTGGASGIGLGMVRAFLGAGMQVVAADIRPDHVQAARAAIGDSGPCIFIELDVTDRAAMALAAHQAELAFGNIHVLCNNAGVGMLGDIRLVTYDDWDWCLGVNLGGAINGVQSFLPRMLDHGEQAHIVNTSSIGAICPGPSAVPYLTAKAALMALSDTLRADLAGLDIGVTTLIPGPTATNIHQVAALRPERFRKSGLKPVEDVLAQGPLFTQAMAPEEVGRLVLEAILEDHPYVITHGAFRPAVEQHFKAILEALPHADEAAIAAMASMMTGRITEVGEAARAAIQGVAASRTAAG